MSFEVPILFAPIVAEPAYDVEPVASAFLGMRPYYGQDLLSGMKTSSRHQD